MCLSIAAFPEFVNTPDPCGSHLSVFAPEFIHGFADLFPFLTLFLRFHFYIKNTELLRFTLFRKLGASDPQKPDGLMVPQLQKQAHCLCINIFLRLVAFASCR